jgi:hypothetical protein
MRSAMTPIRIDRCLQSTILFSKMSAPLSRPTPWPLSWSATRQLSFHTDMLASVGSASVPGRCLPRPLVSERPSDPPSWSTAPTFRRTPVPPGGGRCAPKNAAGFRPPRPPARAHVNGTRTRQDPECLFPVRSPSPGPRLALALPITRQETYGFCSFSRPWGAIRAPRPRSFLRAGTPARLRRFRLPRAGR